MTTKMDVAVNNQNTALHVYAPSYEHAIQALSCHISAVSVNGPDLGLRSERSHTTWEQIASLVKIADEQGSRIYLRVNTIIHNSDVRLLDDILNHGEDVGIHGIVFSDASLVYQKQQKKLSFPLFMATETTVTNGGMIRFWYEQGVDGFLLSRELSFDEIATLVAGKPQPLRGTPCRLEVQIHGPVAIFHTLRPVLTNYAGYLHNKGDVQHATDRQRQLAFREEKRPQELYRVDEDSRGTYIYSAYDISLYEYLGTLGNIGVDSFKIEIHDSQSVDTMVNIIQFYQIALQKVQQGEFVPEVNWLEKLTSITEFPIKNQFIKLGAPL